MKTKHESQIGKSEVKPKEFVRQLFQNLQGASLKARWLKSTANQETLVRVIKALPSYPHPITQFFLGIPWQKELTSLYHKRPQQYLNVSTLVSELQWTAVTIANFSKDLNLFFELKEKCECEFLRGEFTAAGKSHEEIVAKFGVSLWSMQQKFLLLEYASGLEANTKYLSDLNSKKNLHFFIQVMVNFLSMRAERQLSHDNYQHKLSKYLSSYDDQPKLKSFFEHVTGREGAQFDIRDENLVLWVLADGALIDRCLYALSLLQRLFTSQLSESELLSLYPCAKLICESLTTSSARNLSVAIFPDLPIRKQVLDVEVMSVFDKYTQGDYESAVNLSSELLFRFPTSIQLFMLYVKSLIFLGRPFKSPFETQAPAHEILCAVDSVFRKSNNYSQAIESLARFAKSYHQIPLASGLKFLITKERDPKASHRLEQLTLLETRFLDPKIYNVAADLLVQSKILGGLKQVFPDSLTVDFLIRFKANAEPDSTISFPEKLSAERKMRYTATALLQRDMFQDAIPILKSLYEDRDAEGGSTLKYPLYDEIVILLYDAYVGAQHLEEALDIYVANLLTNPLCIHGLNVVNLRNSLENQAHQELSRNIKVPIFYAATLTNPQAIFVPYDNFLTAYGCNRPTDLLSRASDFEHRLVVYFLSHVCVQKVMAGSFHFTGTEALEMERLQILQYLCRIDAPQRPMYSKEIDEITQRIFIRRGIRKADEGKIHVDIEGIRLVGAKLLAESFHRYLDISSLKGIQALKLLDTNVMKLVLTGSGSQGGKGVLDIDKLEAEGVRVIFKSHFALFKDLFIDVRDRFILSSEYGLDSYLSVRIRHGTLQGQLRSRFEALHLVTQRNADTGEYQINSYWDDKLFAYTEEQRQIVQTLLAVLSRDVDELTRRVKDEIIQIRTESRNQNGLFDFRFEDAELFRLFTDEFEAITDYEEFMELVFNTLGNRTKACLSNIQQYITCDVKNEFVKMLSEIQSELRKNLPPGAASELLAAMTSGLTAIQNECDRIARWFIFQGVKYEAFTLREIVNVCVASVNNVNPEIQITPKIEVEEQTIVGNYFHSFFDILRALLDNALRRSGFIGVAPQVCISGKIENEQVVLRMCNTITHQVRDTDPVKALTERIAHIRERGISDEIKKEGGTGYFKIAKILEYDLKRQDASITFCYPTDSQFEVTLVFGGKELLV